jgi:hypothetical protein
VRLSGHAGDDGAAGGGSGEPSAADELRRYKSWPTLPNRYRVLITRAGDTARVTVEAEDGRHAEASVDVQAHTQTVAQLIKELWRAAGDLAADEDGCWEMGTVATDGKTGKPPSAGSRMEGPSANSSSSKLGRSLGLHGV